MTSKKKTFDLRKWLDAAPKVEDHEATFLGETVKIRALRGADWEEYIKVQTLGGGSSAEVILHHGLVAPNGGKYSRDEIHKLFNAYTGPASVLMQKILEITEDVLVAEMEGTEEAEKNSETTGTVEPSTDGAGITEPTREQPNCPGPN